MTSSLLMSSTPVKILNVPSNNSEPLRYKLRKKYQPNSQNTSAQSNLPHRTSQTCHNPEGYQDILGVLAKRNSTRHPNIRQKEVRPPFS